MRVIGGDGQVVNEEYIPLELNTLKRFFSLHVFPIVKKPLLITPLCIDFCCTRMEKAAVGHGEVCYHLGYKVTLFGGSAIDHCPWCGGEIIIKEE